LRGALYNGSDTRTITLSEAPVFSGDKQWPHLETNIISSIDDANPQMKTLEHYSRVTDLVVKNGQNGVCDTFHKILLPQFNRINSGRNDFFYILGTYFDIQLLTISR
jgi:hypothetical protein